MIHVTLLATDQTAHPTRKDGSEGSFAERNAMRLRRLSVLLALSITWLALQASAAFASGTSYYIDCSQGINGSGTMTSPWNSLSAANTHAGGFGAGDKILLKAGTACSGQLAPSGSGMSASPIVVSSYGTGPNAIINGGGTTESAVHLVNQSYWTIENLEVTNDASAEAQRSGVLAEVTNGNTYSGITIANLNVHNVKGISDRNASGRYSSAGILIRIPAVSTGLAGHFNGVTISNNSVHNVTCMGIAIVGGNGADATTHNQNVLVENNDVERPGADGILVGVSQTPLIEQNVSDDAGYAAINTGAIAAIWGYTDSSPTFEFNEAARTQPSGDSEAWDCDWGITGTCTYQYNYSHEDDGGVFLNCTGSCGGGVPPGTTMVFRYNIAQNEGRIDTRTGTAPSLVYNNTFYNAGRSFNLAFPDSDNSIRDNIFVGDAMTITGSGVFDHNLYNGFTAPSGDAHAVTGNPEFMAPGTGSNGASTVNGYELATGSPALGAGAVIANNGGRDYWGNPVSSTAAPNIGAYNGSGLTPPPPNTAGTVVDPGFEGGLSPWYLSVNGGSVTTSVSHSGSASFQTAPATGGANQDITGLQPNVTYVLTAWGKTANAGESVYMGVKNYGNPEQAVPLTGTTWQQGTIDFTTGASNTTATIYCYKVSGTGAGYCDDYTLTPLLVNGDFETASRAPWVGIQTDDGFVVPHDAYTGTFALETPINGHDGVQQTVNNLVPGATYQLRGYAKVLNAGEEMRIGVYNYGNPETYASITSTSYTQGTVNFTMGASNTSATVYCLKQSGLDVGYCDDLTLTVQ